MHLRLFQENKKGHFSQFCTACSLTLTDLTDEIVLNCFCPAKMLPPCQTVSLFSLSLIEGAYHYLQEVFVLLHSFLFCTKSGITLTDETSKLTAGSTGESVNAEEELQYLAYYLAYFLAYQAV